MRINKQSWSISTTFTLRDRIDTNPDYQRPAVWTLSQKQLLIESILRGYDIPKLYWREVSTNPKNYEVVDGQQRLRAIWEFLDNQYSLAKDAEPINDVEIAKCFFKDLDSEAVLTINTYSLDIVILDETDDEEVREMFLRLQNGTTLKAQEKRNAMDGEIRDFVHETTGHKFFTSVNFDNTRFTYDHVVAQMCLLSMNLLSTNKITGIRASELNKMYVDYQTFDKSSNVAKQVSKVLSYLQKMFPSKIPELKRYNVISLYILIASLINDYVLRGREKEIAKWFIDFEQRRKADKENPRYVKYHEYTSHTTDSSEALTYRNTVLIEELMFCIPNLKPKDQQRMFDEAQRQAIFRRDNAVCQICGKICDWSDYEADHKVPWSLGGETSVENGQCLCKECNRKKSAKL